MPADNRSPRPRRRPPPTPRRRRCRRPAMCSRCPSRPRCPPPARPPMSNSALSIGTPAIGRRLISMVYEILLGFAVLFLPFLIFEVASHASHTPTVEHMRQALLFLVLGAYFIHQWSR